MGHLECDANGNYIPYYSTIRQQNDSVNKLRVLVVAFKTSDAGTNTPGSNLASTNIRAKSFYTDHDPSRTQSGNFREHGRLRMSHSDSGGTMLPVQHKRLMMLKHGRSYSTGDTPDDYTYNDQASNGATMQDWDPTISDQQYVEEGDS